MQKREFIRHVSLSLASIIFAVALVEMLCRLFPALLPAKIQIIHDLSPGDALSQYSHSQRSIAQTDGVVGYTAKPNLRTEVCCHPDFRYTVTTSELSGTGIGYRGAPIVPNDHILGVAVGDSFTFGVGVNDDETWTSRLEFLIGKRIINLGMPSASSIQYTRMLDLHGRRLAPRLMFFQVYASDYMDNVAFYAWEKLGGERPYNWGEWRQRVGDQRTWPQLRQHLLHDKDFPRGQYLSSDHFSVPLVSYSLLSHALARVQNSLGRYFEGRTARSRGARMEVGDFYVAPGFDMIIEPPAVLNPHYEPEMLGLGLLRRELKRASEIAQDAGAQLIALYFPTRNETYAELYSSLTGLTARDICPPCEPAGGRGALRDFLKNQDIALFDLTEDFRRVGVNEQLYFRQDGHWNATGNQLAASIIYSFLKEGGYLD